MWDNLPESRKSPRPRCQLEWEAQVVEYVSFVWDKTRPCKKGDVAAKLSSDVPLLGPRFIPPTYLHIQKRSGSYDVGPEVQYLKPVNIIHPFYYPELACCPQCQSSTDVTWEGWTGTGARELHGILQDEVALGLQLRCNTCKLQKRNVDPKNKTLDEQDKVNDPRDPNAPLDVLQVEASSAQSSSYCCVTTSCAYWKQWKHWRIPHKRWRASSRHVVP